MSIFQSKEIKEKQEALFGLEKAPSQNTIFLHLLLTGKTMTVKEISSEIGFTQKATERAVSKLMDKNLIHRSFFREGAYNCDSKEILLILLYSIRELQKEIKKNI
jgi:predicted transcriptional regulator